MKISKYLIVGLVLGMFLFACTDTFAKEKKGMTVSEEYYLVQEYVGNTSITTGEPNKLFCQKEKCSLFFGAIKKRNFFSDKLCKKSYSDEIVSEYSCSDNNITYRLMGLSKDKHDKFLMIHLLSPKTKENKNFI